MKKNEEIIITICLDNSKYTVNGDYLGDRWNAQCMAVVQQLSCLITSIPQPFMIYIITMAGDSPKVHSVLSKDNTSCSSLKKVSLGGYCNIIDSLKLSHLLFKSRDSPHYIKKLLIFSGSPLIASEEDIKSQGVSLFMNQITLEIINFGDSDLTIMDSLYQSANIFDNPCNTHFIEANGTNTLIVNNLLKLHWIDAYRRRFPYKGEFSKQLQQNQLVPLPGGSSSGGRSSSAITPSNGICKKSAIESRYYSPKSKYNIVLDLTIQRRPVGIDSTTPPSIEEKLDSHPMDHDNQSKSKLNSENHSNQSSTHSSSPSSSPPPQPVQVNTYREMLFLYKNSKILMEFPAGKCEYKNNLVVPLPQKGVVVLLKVGIIHFHLIWRNLSTMKIENSYVISYNEVDLLKVDKHYTEDRVFYFKFNINNGGNGSSSSTMASNERANQILTGSVNSSSSNNGNSHQQHFFVWPQYDEESKDERFINSFNGFIRNEEKKDRSLKKIAGLVKFINQSLTNNTAQSQLVQLASGNTNSINGSVHQNGRTTNVTYKPVRALTPKQFLQLYKTREDLNNTLKEQKEKDQENSKEREKEREKEALTIKPPPSNFQEYSNPSIPSPSSSSSSSSSLKHTLTLPPPSSHQQTQHQQQNSETNWTDNPIHVAKHSRRNSEELLPSKPLDIISSYPLKRRHVHSSSSIRNNLGRLSSSFRQPISRYPSFNPEEDEYDIDRLSPSISFDYGVNNGSVGNNNVDRKGIAEAFKLGYKLKNLLSDSRGELASSSSSLTSSPSPSPISDPFISGFSNMSDSESNGGSTTASGNTTPTDSPILTSHHHLHHQHQHQLHRSVFLEETTKLSLFKPQPLSGIPLPLSSEPLPIPIASTGGGGGVHFEAASSSSSSNTSTTSVTSPSTSLTPNTKGVDIITSGNGGNGNGNGCENSPSDIEMIPVQSSSSSSRSHKFDKNSTAQNDGN